MFMFSKNNHFRSLRFFFFLPCLLLSFELMAQSPCRDALIGYAHQYPEAEPRDLYKLCFQDFFGPGHLTIDSVRSSMYIAEEMNAITNDSNTLYEYTLCDSNYVRVNLVVIKNGWVSLPHFVNALIRSVDKDLTPDNRYVVHHTTRFNKAYNFHYRIIRRDIFEKEMLPLIKASR